MSDDLVDWKANPHAPGTPEFNDWIKEAIQRQRMNPDAERAAAVERVYSGFEKPLRTIDGGREAFLRLDQMLARSSAINQYLEQQMRELERQTIDRLSRMMFGGKNYLDDYQGDTDDEKLVNALRDQMILGGSDLRRGRWSFKITEPEKPATIRGKPAPKKQKALCPKHGQPRGQCRKCWR